MVTARTRRHDVRRDPSAWTSRHRGSHRSDVSLCPPARDADRRVAWVEIVWTPTINQGLVRFLSPKPGAMAIDHDVRTDEVVTRIVRSGEAFFGGTTWRGLRSEEHTSELQSHSLSR